VANPAFPTGLNENEGAYPLFYEGFQNQCQLYNVYGAELGVRAFPVEGVDVFANYTLMSIKQDNSACSQAQLALIGQNNDARTSAHKVNVGVQLRTKFGLNGEVVVDYASPQNWAEQVSDSVKQQIDYQSFHLDAYAIVNARLGYRFQQNHAEVSVTAFNLLDDRHREHPFGQIVGRRVMGFLTYRF
jgi:outer membrane receptor protein involved in Fe transport